MLEHFYFQPPGLGDDLMGMGDDGATNFPQNPTGGGPGSVTGSNNPRYDDTLQGLEIGSQQGSNNPGGLYDTMQGLEIGSFQDPGGPNMQAPPPHPQTQHPQHPPPLQQQQQQPPPPPGQQQNNPNQQDQMAAWFDTDL